MANSKSKTLRELSKAYDVLPSDVKKHCWRVQKLCSFFVEQVDSIDFLLDYDIDADLLKDVSYYHDLGLVTRSKDGTYKNAKLNDEQYVKHPERGIKILNTIIGCPYTSKRKNTFEYLLGKIIEQHHEAINGSGFPKGLKDSEICIEAKIIAVLDTFDNLLFSPSHEMLSYDRAYDDLKIAAVKQELDKEIVNIFLKNKEGLNDYVKYLYDPTVENINNLGYGIRIFFREVKDVSLKQICNYIYEYGIKDLSLGLFSKRRFNLLIQDIKAMSKIELLAFEQLCQFVHEENVKGHQLPIIYINFVHDVIIQDHFFKEVGKIMNKNKIKDNQFCFCTSNNEIIFDLDTLIKLSDGIHDLKQKFGLNGFDLDLALSLTSDPSYQIDDILVDGASLDKAAQNRELFLTIQKAIKSIRAIEANIIFDGVKDQKVNDALFYAGAKCAPSLDSIDGRKLSQDELAKELSGIGDFL